MNDVMINKIQSIQRCVQRARQEYELAGTNFATDCSRQDAAILNVTRACEQAIDLANHLLRQHKMGIPSSSAESFQLLARQSIISEKLSDKLAGMVGFRNIAVHQYKSLDLAIVETVIQAGLDEVVEFTQQLVRWVNSMGQQ